MTYARADMPMVLVTWVDSASMSGWQSVEIIEENAGATLVEREQQPLNDQR